MKFADVLEIKSGKKQAQVKNPGGKYPIYGSGGLIGHSDVFLCGADTVIIGRKGTINKPIYSNGPTWIIDTAFGLIANQRILRPKYLYYFCCNYNFNTLNSSSSMIPSVRKSDLQRVEICVPDLEYQDAIVKKLDKVDHLISIRQAQLAYLDDAVKARFWEMFGDGTNPDCSHKYKLEDICVASNGIKCGPFGDKLSKSDYQSSGIAVWEIPQVSSGFFDKPVHYIAKEKADQLKVFTLKSGDIAMTRKGYIGKCALFPEGYPDGIMHSDILRIRVDRAHVNPYFLMYQLLYSHKVRQQIAKISSGAIMDGLNVRMLKNIEVDIPALVLQDEFASFVQACSDLKITAQKSIEELEFLKKSWLHLYFG